MEGGDFGSGEGVTYTIVADEENQGEQIEGPLLVAMQPEVEMPAVEVVVVTENGETLQGGDIQHVFDSSSGQIQVVSVVGAEEEVKEELDPTPAATIITGDNKVSLRSKTKATVPGTSRTSERRGTKRGRPPPPSSDSEEESSSSSENENEDDDDDDDEPRSKKPKKRDFAYRLQWKNKDMQEAMKAVSDRKMTIRGAAKKFAVPYSTLKDRIHGRVQHGTKPGVKTALSPEEEEELVRYIKDMESAGFQMRCIDVRDRAGEILQLHHGHNTPYKDCSPGHNWLAGFLKRHPGLEFKKSMNRSVVPSLAKQKSMCKKFYEIVTQTYRKHRLLNKPERVYTVSEMKISSFIKASVLVCAAADGTVIPPFVVFPGQRLKLTSARNVYPEAFFTNSHDGKVNDAVLLWWFRDHFLKKLPSAGHRPCVLYLGRSVNEITFQLAQQAREERIHIISIPPGVSHLLQPLDDAVAVSLESAVSKKAKKWQEENPGNPFNQKILAQILQKVWRKGINADDIIRRFAANGVFPVDPTAITTDRIASASAALKEASAAIGTPSPSSNDNTSFSGLSLLSALSSHEYASLEHFYADKDNETKSASPVLDRAHSSYNSPGSARKVVVHVNKKAKLGLDESEEGQVEDTEADEQGGASSTWQTSQEIQHLINQVAEEISHTQKENEESPPPKIHKELVAAKDNRDQINRAVESIGGVIGEEDDGPQVLEVKDEKNGSEFRDLSTEQIQVQGEIVQEIECEEVVTENIVEDAVAKQEEDGTIQEQVVVQEDMNSHIVKVETSSGLVQKEEGKPVLISPEGGNVMHQILPDGSVIEQQIVYENVIEQQPQEIVVQDSLAQQEIVYDDGQSAQQIILPDGTQVVGHAQELGTIAQIPEMVLEQKVEEPVVSSAPRSILRQQMSPARPQPVVQLGSSRPKVHLLQVAPGKQFHLIQNSAGDTTTPRVIKVIRAPASSAALPGMQVIQGSQANQLRGTGTPGVRIVKLQPAEAVSEPVTEMAEECIMVQEEVVLE